MSVFSSCIPEALPVTLRAGCKVNVHLFLTGIRDSGWHDIDSIFIPLNEPHDTLTLTARSGQLGQPEVAFFSGQSFPHAYGTGPELIVSCSTPGIDRKCNTLTQAYTAFYVATGFGPLLNVHLEKGIPHGAGLGGGSADAAVLLRWLNTQALSCGQALSEPDLHALAAGVGADLPFFLQNTPSYATGIGDTLCPLKPEQLAFVACAPWLVLVCPPDEVPTPWAYRTFDMAIAAGTFHTFLTGRETQAISLVSACAERPGTVLVNDFEPVVCARHPRICACKEALLRAGAKAAVMSGSGASLVGLFDSERMARDAATACEHMFAATRTWVHNVQEQAIDGV